MKLNLSLRNMLVALAVTTAALPYAYAEGETAPAYVLNGESQEWTGTNIAPSTDGNTVQISGISSDEVTVYGTYTESSTNASNNDLKVSSGSALSEVRGGYIYHPANSTGGAGDADNNTVEVTDSTIKSYVDGGRIEQYFMWNGTATGSTDKNHVTVTNSSTGAVSGGNNSGQGSASENVVTVKGSSTGSITGGNTGGEANGNIVTISENSSVSSTVYGGQGDTKVNGNNVTLSNSTTKDIYGGYQKYSFEGEASHNTVTITDTNTKNIRGGYSKGYVADNHVTLTGSADEETTYTAGDVYGGAINSSGTAEKNTVTITNYTVASVYGGQTNGAGTASDNTVTMTNSQATYVYGGSTSGGASSNNTVTLDGCTVTNKVFGGYSSYGSTGTASNNTVILKGVSDLSGAEIYGGSGGTCTDNKLQMEGLESSVYSVQKFDAIEQTGGEVTILSGKLDAGKTMSIKGTDSANAAVLMSGASNGALSVSGAESVTMENAALQAEGVVTVKSSGGISIKNSAIVGTGLDLGGEGDATTRVLENVNIILAAGGMADLSYSTLKGSTSITAIAPYTMMANSDETVTVLLEGSTVELDDTNTTVTSNSDGTYIIDATSFFSGVDVKGSFTLDITALEETLSDFESIEIQLQKEAIAADSLANVSVVLGEQTYVSKPGESGNGVTFGPTDTVPEPTTATLSLLALAALAARRRRK